MFLRRNLLVFQRLLGWEIFWFERRVYLGTVTKHKCNNLQFYLQVLFKESNFSLHIRMLHIKKGGGRNHEQDVTFKGIPN